MHEVPVTGVWQRGRLESRGFAVRFRGPVPIHLDVAQWSKATACKAAGASPRPFALGGAADQDVAKHGPKAEGSEQSDRRAQASLAQWTRATGFYPVGRPFESVTRHQFISPIAQLAARLAVNQEVRGSKPRRGASSV